jgi:hypothetical protein
MHKDYVNNSDSEVKPVIQQLIISRPAPRLLSTAVTYTYDCVFGFDTIHFRTAQCQEHSLHHRASMWRTACKGRLSDRQKQQPLSHQTVQINLKFSNNGKQRLRHEYVLYHLFYYLHRPAFRPERLLMLVPMTHNKLR